MTDEQLAALIAHDEFGLFTIKPRPTPKDSDEERLLSKFEDVLSSGRPSNSLFPGKSRNTASTRISG